MWKVEYSKYSLLSSQKISFKIFFLEIFYIFLQNNIINVEATKALW